MRSNFNTAVPFQEILSNRLYIPALVGVGFAEGYFRAVAAWASGSSGDCRDQCSRDVLFEEAVPLKGPNPTACIGGYRRGGLTPWAVPFMRSLRRWYDVFFAYVSMLTRPVDQPAVFQLTLHVGLHGTSEGSGAAQFRGYDISFGGYGCCCGGARACFPRHFSDWSTTQM